MPNGVTKEDLNRVHERIDDLAKAIAGMAVHVAQIATTLENLPPLPRRPCTWHRQLRRQFDDHIADHEETIRDWRQAVIRAVVDVLKIAFVAGMGLIIGILLHRG